MLSETCTDTAQPNAAMLQATPTIALRENELAWRFVRASGPGGQNVNKVSSAVQLRFDVRGSESLPEEVRERLLHLARNRINRDGVLVIDARRFRAQERNREDARARLAALVRRAAQAPTPRVATRPTRASKRRRIESKHRRAMLKQTRRSPADDE